MRLTDDQINEGLVDAAAGLFARHGFRQGTVQAVADATGYSKAAVLKRFTSKERLQAEVIAAVISRVGSVSQLVQHQPRGRERDVAVITALVDLALGRQGWIALVLSAMTTGKDPDLTVQLEPIVRGLFSAFDATPGGPDEARNVRITGALGVVAVATLALGGRSADQLRPHIIAISCAALWA